MIFFLNLIRMTVKSDQHDGNLLEKEGNDLQLNREREQIRICALRAR